MHYWRVSAFGRDSRISATSHELTLLSLSTLPKSCGRKGSHILLCVCVSELQRHNGLGGELAPGCSWYTESMHSRRNRGRKVRSSVCAFSPVWPRLMRPPSKSRKVSALTLPSGTITTHTLQTY
ncbi:unnamed protein product [Ectocarpus sp. 4 AP-2014]